MVDKVVASKAGEARDTRSIKDVLFEKKSNLPSPFSFINQGDHKPKIMEKLEIPKDQIIDEGYLAPMDKLKLSDLLRSNWAQNLGITSSLVQYGVRFEREDFPGYVLRFKQVSVHCGRVQNKHSQKDAEKEVTADEVRIIAKKLGIPVMEFIFEQRKALANKSDN